MRNGKGQFMKGHAVVKHGMFGTRTYRAWHNMLSRCRNAKCRDYINYGGRGIKVCERWLSFENFLADMGECPPTLTLDRKDNDKGYEPTNCRWATRATQRRNARHCKLTFADVLAIRSSAERGVDLARRYGVTKTTITDVRKRRSWKQGDQP